MSSMMKDRARCVEATLRKRIRDMGLCPQRSAVRSDTTAGAALHTIT